MIKNLMNTKIEEATIGDSLKMQALALTAMVGSVVAFSGAVNAKAKLDTWKFNRELKKEIAADNAAAEEN